MNKEDALIMAFSLIIVFIFLTQPISAFSAKYIIDDYNSLQPIDTATVVLSNGTSAMSGITDAHGEYSFILNASQIYNVSVSHSGYSPYGGVLNATNDSVENIYLSPSTHEGIIRLSIIDLTFGDHKSLIYFDNGRIQGIYQTNDTITLHTNLNYSWTPSILKTDLLMNKKGLQKYAWNYLGIGIGVIVLFSFVALFIGFLWRIMKK